MSLESRKPYKLVSFEGFEIFIGKSDVDNDLLTFDIAAECDLWLHVGEEYAGSHVVIRNPSNLECIPDTVLRKAAELAAWNSKARNVTSVKVHYCWVRDVSKSKKSQAGTAHISKYKEIKVNPKSA